MSATGKKDNPSQAVPVTIPYRSGQNPDQDAWFTAFYIENHLDPYTHPDHAASLEQTRFMVFTEEDERYYPCSDRMFQDIMARQKPKTLRDGYQEALTQVLRLIDQQIEDPFEKQYLEALINIKFKHETRDGIMIPSRLRKRLLRIFLDRTQIEDPWLEEKRARNRRAMQALNSDAFIQAFNAVDNTDRSDTNTSLAGLREFIEHLEIKRLLALTAASELWKADLATQHTSADYRRLLDCPLHGNGIEALFAFLDIRRPSDHSRTHRPKKIMWIADQAGETIIDLTIIKFLVKLGHTVIVVFKEGPLFNHVDLTDLHGDSTLAKMLEGAMLIVEKHMSKNDLAAALSKKNHIYAITDGTCEDLNLLLASTTFARLFKEVDGIISRGPTQKRRFFETHFQFTQDIYNICTTDSGAVCVDLKPKHPMVVKFSQAGLEQKAKVIIDRMQDAKHDGMTVIFYSGIIGSIPGKIDMAKRIMSVFIDHLNKQSTHTHIINPSDHYESGMDADDLMYMWEIVQRSGLIDIWQFQTYDDIAEAFEIIGRKIPPEWVGKDATFSTGCTKEMHIAIDVQRRYPEMQIIGPSQEKFVRRGEYGIGKMYDRRLIRNHIEE